MFPSQSSYRILFTCCRKRMDNVDWDKGLPVDLLALVAKAGGISAMKLMRLVSKMWQQGFDLGVSRIKIHHGDPSLPWGTGAAYRFPALASLDVGECYMNDVTLSSLRFFPQLNSVVLGAEGFANSLKVASQLTDNDLEPLRDLPLTRLDLCYCSKITPEVY